MVTFNMKGHVQPILLYSLDLLLTLKDVGSSFLLFVLVCVSSDLFCWLVWPLVALMLVLRLILEVYLMLLCPFMFYVLVFMDRGAISLNIFLPFPGLLAWAKLVFRWSSWSSSLFSSLNMPETSQKPSKQTRVSKNL